MEARIMTVMRMKQLVYTLFVLFIGTRAWSFTPPIGIPTPPFPADLDVARPSPPSPWTAESAGNYYVERSAAGCSDSRTYGTPTAPRCSLPSSPAAGSKIFVNGTYATGGTISWTGTAGSPIWLLSYNDSNKPLFTGTSPQPLYVTGSYIIIDGIRHDLLGATNDQFGMYGSNVMVRNSSFRNTFGAGGGCGINVAGTNQVVYNSTIYDQGNWQYVGADIDRHGFKISPPTNGLWILDSFIYHVQGDGVQVGDQNNTSSQINRVFVGRVTSYENLQSCLWTKNATDVVFSQNVCYNITAPGSNSGDGQGMGGQYDPKYVWFIANRIYNTKNGIKIQSASSGGGGPWYAIGNVIDNVKAGTCDPYGNGGLSTRNSGGFYIFFNTVYNVDSFVSMVHSNAGTVRNNIFAAKSGTCDAINGFDGDFTIDYNLYDSASYSVGYNGASYSNLAAFSSATGLETHRVVGNPLFISPPSNFALQSSSSPAYNTANPVEEAAFATYQTRYGVDIRKDFLGTTRPYGTRWDMGAYEFNDGAVQRYPNPPTNLMVQ